MDGMLIGEAARRLGVSHARVRELIRMRRIGVLGSIGGFLQLDPDDVEREVRIREERLRILAALERM